MTKLISKQICKCTIFHSSLSRAKELHILSLHSMCSLLIRGGGQLSDARACRPHLCIYAHRQKGRTGNILEATTAATRRRRRTGNAAVPFPVGGAGRKLGGRCACADAVTWCRSGHCLRVACGGELGVRQCVCALRRSGYVYRSAVTDSGHQCEYGCITTNQPNTADPAAKQHGNCKHPMACSTYPMRLRRFCQSALALSSYPILSFVAVNGALSSSIRLRPLRFSIGFFYSVP